MDTHDGVKPSLTLNMGTVILYFTNQFRAEVDKFDHFKWEKANLYQIGNFL